jgi:hypothetical protein
MTEAPSQHAPIAALGALNSDVSWVRGVLVQLRLSLVRILFYEPCEGVLVGFTHGK